MNVTSFIDSLQDLDFSDISSWPHALKIIASLIVGLVILVVIYILLYMPKFESLETAINREQSLKREYENKQKLAANLPAYQQQMVEIQSRFDNVLRQLPDKSEVPALLTDISQAGLEQGLVFERFKPSKAEQKNFYVRLPVVIESSGNYHQLAGFISAIANFQRVVTIGDFTITRNRVIRNDPGIQPPPLTLEAEIYTYHFSEAEKLDSVSGAASRVRKR